MSKKTTTLLLAILMGLCYPIYSQKMLSKATELAQNGQDQEAIEIYESYLKDNSQDYQSAAALAEVYARCGQFGQSIYTFNRIPSDVLMTVDFYTHFGNTLKRVGRYSEALDVFNRQKKVDLAEAESNILSCNFAIQSLTKSPENDIEVLPFNSRSSEFGLTFYKDMPVFTSFRDDVLMDETQKAFNPDNHSHRTFSYSIKNNKVNFVLGNDGRINHVGPLSFSSDGRTCAMIESKIPDNLTYSYDHQSSTLYIAKINERGEITSSIPFEHNEVVSSINSATFSDDGQSLYFSSNRAGGLGRFDIYVSYLNDGKWSLPVNLGSSINTKGDEITPLYHNDKLYFSSSMHDGIGGFDVFESFISMDTWTKPQNMGNGINSMNDEYFPVFDKKNNLYITSNRLGGTGGHDIYRVRKINTMKPDFAYEEIPKAVNLEELEREISQHTSDTGMDAKAVSNMEPKVTILSESPKIERDKLIAKSTSSTATVGSGATNMTAESRNSLGANMSLAGVYRIGFNKELPTSEVYFIQLASMAANKPNFARFKPLVKYGNIYRMMNNKLVKVRLGYFDKREEAEQILLKVRGSGFSDAFLTQEMLNTAKMELVLSSSDEKSFTDEGNFNTTSKDPQIRDFKANGKYKVRLASYEDPTWFDLEKVRDLGRVEQWTKGGWTIFVLAGYGSLEDAKKASITANNRGFKSAEVVIDNGGILERLKQN